jgi:exopolysaccharide biosynthesis polyprenyl glycosylphosphotransferase
MGLKEPVINGFDRVVKRIFDLVIATATLLLLWPVMLIIAIAIKLDSPGPAILKQERVGENGRIFTVYKFRSMVQDADKMLNDVIQRTDDGAIIHKRPDDPRITRVGRFIRRTSLDELPQLFNVVKGDMSMVGPRPELPFIVENYESWQHKRFAVQPGITGWWQINGRSDKPMHMHTEDDLYYISHYSPLLDLQILFKTVGVVLRGKGAY